MKKKLLTMLLVMALIAMSAACGGSDDETVRIAVAAPMTGDNAEYGIGFRNAVQLQVEAWNEAGGVLGREIEMVVFDDANSAEEAATVAQQIVADRSIMGVVGHFSSGVAMTAAPTYEEHQVINISPTAGHPDFSSIGAYIFRNNTVVYQEAAEGLDIAIDMGLTQIGILSIMTDWGTTTADIVTELIAEKEGLELVAHEEVLEGTVDYSPAITAFENAGAEVIIVVSMYATLAPFAVQYRSVNPEIELIGFSNAYSHQLLALGGDALEGLKFPVTFFSDSPYEHVQDFVTRYIAQFGYSPSSLTARAYDSAGMILEAIANAGSTEDRTAIREALANISYYGVTGEPPTTFTPGGDVLFREFTRVMIRNGEFVRVGQ